MIFHICGINKYSLNIFKALKKKKFEVTISDLKKKNEIKKKIKIPKDLKNFYFSGHPQKQIIVSDKIIISPGVIKSNKDFKIYLRNKKMISELDLFYMLNKWDKTRILLVTGSRGKTTLCRKIYSFLKNFFFFKNIYYMDRNKFTFSTLPDFKKNFFLIAEIDYQALLIAKSIKAKYRIITSFNYNENKAFESNFLYLRAKKKIVNTLEKKDYLITDESAFKKLKIKYKKTQIIKTKNIKKKNIEFLRTFKQILKKNNENN